MALKKISNIKPNECIGNSLNTINTNFQNLQDGSDKLFEFSNSIVDYLNETTLFIPANIKTRSNQRVVLERLSTRESEEETSRANLLNIPEGLTTIRDWWSPPFKINKAKIDPPKGCIGVFIKVRMNLNLWANDFTSFLIKERNQPQYSANKASPYKPGAPLYQPDKEEKGYYIRMGSLDPVGGSGLTKYRDTQQGRPFEIATTFTNIVYLDDDKSFTWRFQNNRNASVTDDGKLRYNVASRSPEVGLVIELLGYYVDVNLKKIA